MSLPQQLSLGTLDKIKNRFGLTETRLAIYEPFLSDEP